MGAEVYHVVHGPRCGMSSQPPLPVDDLPSDADAGVHCNRLLSDYGQDPGRTGGFVVRAGGR